jgi:hypothetical protein
LTTQGPDRNAIARALIGAEEPPPSTWARPGRIVSPQVPGAAASANARPQPLWSEGGWRPVSAEQIAAARARPAAAPEPVVTASAPVAKGRSLLEFLASKGGLEPTSELMGILGRNRFLGRHGWILRKGGLTDDQAREAAAEAGYLVNEGRGGGPNAGGGTSTIRDLHEAINDEQRGRKRYAMGEERPGEVDFAAGRHHFEQAVMEHFDREGIPEPTGSTRARVLKLVEKEGMSPLDAHERAILEEYNAGSDQGLSALPIAGTGKALNPNANAAPKAGVQAAPAQRQSQGAVPRGASRMVGEGHPGARQPSPQIPPAVKASDVRQVQHLGLIGPTQHAALAGKNDADIAASLGLSVRQVKSVREHLGIAPARRLMRPGDEDIPFARGGAVHGARPAREIHGLDIDYIKRTIGRDGDHVDVYLGPTLKSPYVYLVGQYDAAGQFRGWKVFLGFGSAAQIRNTKAFSDGRGHVTKMSIDQFKRWLADNAASAQRAA